MREKWDVLEDSWNGVESGLQPCVVLDVVASILLPEDIQDDVTDVLDLCAPEGGM